MADDVPFLDVNDGFGDVDGVVGDPFEVAGKALIRRSHVSSHSGSRRISTFRPSSTTW